MWILYAYHVIGIRIYFLNYTAVVSVNTIKQQQLQKQQQYTVERDLMFDTAAKDQIQKELDRQDATLNNNNIGETMTYEDLILNDDDNNTTNVNNGDENDDFHFTQPFS